MAIMSVATMDGNALVVENAMVFAVQQATEEVLFQMDLI